MSKKNPKTHWDDKKKQELLQSYILLGNLRQCAALSNVPEITARKWKATTWWKEQEDELRRGSKLRLTARLSTIVGKALDQLEDRIALGDFVQTRVIDPITGKAKTEFVRQPVKAEHMNKIAVQLIDRGMAVERASAPEQQTDEGLEQRLLKLRQEMLDFARGRGAVIHQVIPTSKEFTDVLFLESVVPSSEVRPGQAGQGEGQADTSPGSQPTGPDTPSGSPGTPGSDSGDALPVVETPGSTDSPSGTPAPGTGGTSDPA